MDSIDFDTEKGEHIHAYIMQCFGWGPMACKPVFGVFVEEHPQMNRQYQDFQHAEARLQGLRAMLSHH